MKAILELPETCGPSDPTGEFDPDECFSPALVEAFLDEYTQPGDLVFDPFAGSGTTLLVAQRMGRRALGLELQPERIEYIGARLGDGGQIIEADARALNELDLPQVDFTITSPPYMTTTDHPQNPLTAYRTDDGHYRRYLDELTLVHHRLSHILAPRARVVINAANLRDERTGAVTPLAWDIAGALSRVLTLEREIVLSWERPRPWFTCDYCLVFTAPERPRG